MFWVPALWPRWGFQSAAQTPRELRRLDYNETIHKTYMEEAIEEFINE